MIFDGGKHEVRWHGTSKRRKENRVLQWAEKTGVADSTGQRVYLWSRNEVYRGEPPKDASKCPVNNWAFHPYSGANNVQRMKKWFENMCGNITIF